MKRFLLVLFCLSFQTALFCQEQNDDYRHGWPKPAPLTTVILKPAPDTAQAVALAQSEDQKIDQAKFEPLYRATKDLEGSLSVGANYVKFGELLQAFSREVLIAKDKATSEKEKELIALYAESLACYADSDTVWKAKIESTAWKGDIPFAVSNIALRRKNRTRWTYIPGLKDLVDKYSLHYFILFDAPMQLQDSQCIHADEAIQIIWAKAKTLLNEANQAYLAQQLPAK